MVNVYLIPVHLPIFDSWDPGIVCEHVRAVRMDFHPGIKKKKHGKGGTSPKVFVLTVLAMMKPPFFNNNIYPLVI